MPIDPSRLFRSTLVAALWLVPPAAAGAQAALPAGARVRVTIRDAYPGRTTGTLVAIGGDSMRYTPDGDSATRTVRIDRVQRLEIGRGMHRHVWQGFLTGAVAGSFTGVVLGYASGDDPQQAFLSMTRGDKAALAGAILGVLGGGVGTIVGYLHRSERWERVQPPYTVTLAPQRGGIRLALRVGF